MQQSFPVLTSLHIISGGLNVPVLPAEFLGGSAPSLRNIYMRCIPFPALPTLLLSTSDLVTLQLENIPPTGYISTEVMIVGLAVLPRLIHFVIHFQSASPRPDGIQPSPPIRTVLPALTFFQFQGASEYLEDLVYRVDAPQLNRILIRYLNQLIDFQVAQLSMFMDRSVGPKLTSFRHARVTFHSHLVTFRTYGHANDSSPETHHAITTVLCQGMAWQVSHMARVFSHFSTTLSNVVHLKLELEKDRKLEGTDEVEWIHLLHRLPTVQTLHVSHDLSGHVALALENIARGTVAEVLPSLDLIYLAGQPASSIEEFVAARRLSDCSVTVVETQSEFNEKLKSYVSK